MPSEAQLHSTAASCTIPFQASERLRATISVAQPLGNFNLFVALRQPHYPDTGIQPNRSLKLESQ